MHHVARRSGNGVWHIVLEGVALSAQEVELLLHRNHDFSNILFHPEIKRPGRVFAEALGTQVFANVRMLGNQAWLAERPNAANTDIRDVLKTAISECLAEVVAQIRQQEARLHSAVCVASRLAAVSAPKSSQTHSRTQPDAKKPT